MRQIRRISNIAIWLICAVVVFLFILARTTPVQNFIGAKIASALGEKLGTEVHIGRADLGFLNRFIIDDVLIYDQKQVPLLKAGRISVKFDLLKLADGQISISSAQLFGLQVRMYRANVNAKDNFQFVLDSLASKDSSQSAPLNLAIKSLVIRNGHVVYDKQYAPRTKSFSTDHIDISGISTHIMLNALQKDSLNLFVKKLSCMERSGLIINDLSFSVIANKQGAVLNDLVMNLPDSEIKIPKLSASYHCSNDTIITSSINYSGGMTLRITPTDFSSLAPPLHGLTQIINADVQFQGTPSLLRVTRFVVKQNSSLELLANGVLRNWVKNPQWNVNITKLHLSRTGICYYKKVLSPHLSLPSIVDCLGDVDYKGMVARNGNALSLSGLMQTGIGDVKVLAQKKGATFEGTIETRKLNLGSLVANSQLGNMSSQLSVQGELASKKITQLTAKGSIAQLEYNGYNYQNVLLDGQYVRNVFNGTLSVNDPNAIVDIEGQVTLGEKSAANINAKIRGVNLAKLHITDKWKGAVIDANVGADIRNLNVNDALGSITISNLRLHGGDNHYELKKLMLNANRTDSRRLVDINGDFGNVEICGRYDYTTILQSLTNIIASKLPTLPGLPKVNDTTKNNFQIRAKITKADWLNTFLNIPINLTHPLLLQGSINDQSKQINLTLNMPSFDYGNNSYRHGYIRLESPNDTLKAFAHIRQTNDETPGTYWNINARAAHNKLQTLLSFENNNNNRFSGILDTEAEFYNNAQGQATARLNILPSAISMGDSIWKVKSSTIDYYKNHLSVNRLTIEHNKQHIIVDGKATKNPADTMLVDLQDVDVSYVLNLINFHSVEFSGKATGLAHMSSLFGSPEAKADLWVRDFRFEDGRMGILSASVNLNKEKEQLDIDATAYDEADARTYIKGYVSPKRNYIDLHVNAHNTRGEFMESFCGSFMRDTQLKINGNVRVFGDLSEVNLEGEAKVNGSLGIKPLNTTYALEDCLVKLVPDDIQLNNCEIADRNGNRGIVNGHLYHKHLTQLSYDIGVKADNLLAYDFKSYGGQTFYGTVFATGDCRIRGKSGEVIIDAEATPQKNSFIEYNAASPDAISNQSFIHWNSRDSVLLASRSVEKQAFEDGDDPIDIPSDIHINLQINCTPDATLRVLMDQQSGDYIALQGNGAIRATYFNKGDFDMYGTYEVQSGIYKLTIQNVLRRDFQFLPGGTIGFGGNAMDAQLNLKAQYAVNGVSLSDLYVGKSFTSNNIRVNCLMNIGGTPSAPRVDFGLDLPTISNDAKQMITQLINSEEGMNQQVLYLLAVGRFYSQNNNSNSSMTAQQSRTSLAMQSILSTTLSQQLNTILGSVTKNDNWNLGANISTGDEGWNNAEYEGLLSGRMFNNRLLFNGQFGYRDNANATTSFIGDFDLQYLIYPNGNLAVRVYNQTNDRYFTKNSLNTQGVGLILKKDYNGFRELFGLKKSSKKKKHKAQKRKTTKTK